MQRKRGREIDLRERESERSLCSNAGGQTNWVLPNEVFSSFKHLGREEENITSFFCLSCRPGFVSRPLDFLFLSEESNLSSIMYCLVCRSVFKFRLPFQFIPLKFSLDHNCSWKVTNSFETKGNLVQSVVSLYHPGYQGQPRLKSWRRQIYSFITQLIFCYFFIVKLFEMPQYCATFNPHYNA